MVLISIEQGVAIPMEDQVHIVKFTLYWIVVQLNYPPLSYHLLSPVGPFL